jgi:membrane associated rhomboid family serine protease
MMMHAPPTREPMFNMPPPVVGTLAVLIAVHALRAVLSDVADFRLVLDLSFVPAEWTAWWDPKRAHEIVAAASDQAPERLALARYAVAHPLHAWSPITYALVHASWAHVLLNAVWLAAFGTPVARRWGSARFLLLLALAALGGALVQYAADPLSPIPVLGASAAVSGTIGAAVHFVFVPWPGASPAQRDGSWRAMLVALATNRSALLFLGLWFLSNLLFAFGATPMGITEGSVAWQAHIGGLVTGLLLFPLLDRRRSAG